MDIKEQLVFICKKLRTSPMPISDIIPIVQKAKDRIQELEEKIRELENPTKIKIPALLKKPIKNEN